MSKGWGELSFNPSPDPVLVNCASLAVHDVLDTLGVKSDSKLIFDHARCLVNSASQKLGMMRKAYRNGEQFISASCLRCFLFFRCSSTLHTPGQAPKVAPVMRAGGSVTLTSKCHKKTWPAPRTGLGTRNDLIKQVHWRYGLHIKKED